MLAEFFCHITVLWTTVSARILALVLQLYERNKLKLKLQPGIAFHAPQTHSAVVIADASPDAITSSSVSFYNVSS